MIKTLIKNLLFYSTELTSNVYFALFKKYQIGIVKDFLFIESDRIGDIIIKFPFYKKFLEKYPEKVLDLITSNKQMGSIINSLFPSISPIEIDYREFLYNPLYRIRKLKNLNVYKNIIITSPFRPPAHIMLAKSIPGNKKFIYAGEKIHRNDTIYKYDKYFTIIKNPFLAQFKYRNIDNHIFQHLNIYFNSIFKLKSENPKVDFYKIFEKLRKIIKKPPINNKYIVLVPDASFSYRSYPPPNWQAILNSLPKNIKIIKIGLNKFSLSHPNLIDLTGKTSLEEAMSLVINAALVIGNETGLTHLAYLSGVPTVCILGGGHFGRFLPWPEFDDVVKTVYIPMSCFQCGWKCKYVNLQKGEVPPCIAEIPPKQVMEAVDELNEKFKIF